MLRRGQETPRKEGLLQPNISQGWLCAAVGQGCSIHERGANCGIARSLYPQTLLFSCQDISGLWLIPR